MSKLLAVGSAAADITLYLDCFPQVGGDETIKEITRNALARATNTRFEVINKWYQGHVEKIDTDVLARICYILECTPGDIIVYNSKSK